VPSWSSTLRNLYWFLRYKRRFDQAGRRRYYRLIEKEKRRLVEEVGVDQEEVRLLCRFLANLKNSNAEQRWKTYAAQMRLSLE
jgi:hypothetical protein